MTINGRFVGYTRELLKAVEAQPELPVDVVDFIYALQDEAADEAIGFFLTHGIKITLSKAGNSSAQTTP